MTIVTWLPIVAASGALGFGGAALVLRRWPWSGREGRLALASLASAAIQLPLGVVGTLLGLRHAFAVAEQEAPANKATQLAAGISEAMNCIAVAVILLVPSATVALVAIVSSGRRKRRAAAPT